MTSNPSRRRQDLVVGLVLLAIGAGLLTGTFSVSALPGQDSLGPRLFPALIGAGLVMLGAAHFVQMRRKGDAVPANVLANVPANVPEAAAVAAEADADLPPGHWPTLAWVVAGIAAGAAIYNFLGFILAAIAIFVLTARGFAGHFRPLHVVIGIIVAVIVYVGFTQGLGLRLPVGSLFKGWF